MATLSDEQLLFARAQRVARLATADRRGHPHLVPVCYACSESSFYVALDDKPKRSAPDRLKRVRNILENPHVALTIDHYEEDWSKLAYLLVRGTAALLQPPDPEHAAALTLLRARYPQYRSMPLEGRPMIVIRLESAVSWSAGRGT